jgi:hypothetical protein
MSLAKSTVLGALFTIILASDLPAQVPAAPNGSPAPQTQVRRAHRPRTVSPYVRYRRRHRRHPRVVVPPVAASAVQPF